MGKVHQLFGGLDHLHGPEVDAAEHDTRLLRGADIGLQWRLTIQFDGQVDDVATLHETVGRSISPASCDVDTNGRSAPNNLIVGNLFSRSEECGVWSEITLEGEICGWSTLTPHSTLLTPGQ